MRTTQHSIAPGGLTSTAAMAPLDARVTSKCSARFRFSVPAPKSFIPSRALQ